MMPPLYRIAEICVYSLLNFLPFMALALYPFRSRLRFSAKITVCIIVVISFIQMGLGLWAAFFSGGKAALASVVSTAVYVVFYFIAVKVNFGQGAVHLAYDLKHGEFCRGGIKVHRRENLSRDGSTAVPLVVLAYNAGCAGGGVDTAFHLHKKGV